MDANMETDAPDGGDTALQQEEIDATTRRNYRNIRDRLHENRLQLVDPNSDHLEAALIDVENNFKNVNKPREAVSDSYILLQLARLGKERIRNVHCEFRSFNNNDFMKKMRAFMTGRKPAADDESDEEESDNDVTLSRTAANKSRIKKESKRGGGRESYVLTRPVLKKFGSQCMRYFHVPPRPTFLLGALEKDIAVTNKRKYTRKAAEQPEVTEKQRTKIKELDANSKETETNNTISEVERVFSVLKKFHKKLKQQPICYYTFVVNPESFSRTIENIFYVSFLIKDGYAKLYLDRDNLPVLEPILDKDQAAASNAENATAKGQKKGVNNIQSMIQMTKIEWREIIETFGIQSAAIPNPN